MQRVSRSAPSCSWRIYEDIHLKPPLPGPALPQIQLLGLPCYSAPHPEGSRYPTDTPPTPNSRGCRQAAATTQAGITNLRAVRMGVGGAGAVSKGLHLQWTYCQRHQMGPSSHDWPSSRIQPPDDGVVGAPAGGQLPPGRRADTGVGSMGTPLHLSDPLHWSTLQFPKARSNLGPHSDAATFQLARNVDK